MIALALNRAGTLARTAPGIALCGLIAVLADQLRSAGTWFWGRPLVDPVVLAILLGTLARSIWCPGPEWTRGITVSAKQLLEVSVVLLGASVDAKVLTQLGPPLLIGAVLIVSTVLPASYLLGRALGLGHKIAVLLACGNAICGNAAIGAIAPIVGADAKEITAAVSFTAALGVLVVLALPAFSALLSLTPIQFGIVAGLTVYSVPQVLAATVPTGCVSSQIGTVVKMIRVLMLGPVMLVVAALDATRRPARKMDQAGTGRRRAGHLRIGCFVPWFVLGFCALAALRSFGGLPAATLTHMQAASHVLTVNSMAALGLGVDLRSLVRSGTSIILTATGSLSLLASLSVVLVLTIR